MILNHNDNNQLSSDTVLATGLQGLEFMLALSLVGHRITTNFSLLDSMIIQGMCGESLGYQLDWLSPHIVLSL